LVRNEDYEFILLCWDKGSLTPIHGHDEKDCWVFQVSGQLKESRFTEIESGFELTNEMVLNAGQITYMHDRMGYHKIENLSNQRAMSLHVYACPINTCKIYNEELSQFEIKQMEYDSVAEQAEIAGV
jgi:cysteine dioxygenase